MEEGPGGGAEEVGEAHAHLTVLLHVMGSVLSAKWEHMTLDEVMKFPLDDKAMGLANSLVDKAVEMKDVAAEKKAIVADDGTAKKAFLTLLTNTVKDTDDLVQHLKSYHATAVAFRQRWMVRFGLEQDPKKLSGLDDCLGRAHTDYLVKTAMEGVFTRIEQRT